MKKLLFILAVTLLASCTSAGDASVEKTLVVEQVKANEKTVNCNTCLQNEYAYRVKLKTHSGSLYYYTNYKHEVGDTLVSIFEFTDSRDVVIKMTEFKLDSVITLNFKTQRKNDELELYNQLLMGIIQENAKGEK